MDDKISAEHYQQPIEDVLICSGWTVNETLRPQAHHILLDLLASYQGPIKQVDLIAAINIFAKNLHDNTLPPGAQLMSCKAFSHLIQFVVAPLSEENIEQREISAARDLLMRIIEIFVLKFKNIAVFHLPHIKKKILMQPTLMQPSNPDVTGVSNMGSQASQQSQVGSINLNRSTMREIHHVGGADNVLRDERSRFDLSSSSTIQYYSVMECKNALKSLIFGVKTAIEAIPSYRSAEQSAQILSQPGARRPQRRPWCR